MVYSRYCGICGDQVYIDADDDCCPHCLEEFSGCDAAVSMYVPKREDVRHIPKMKSDKVDNRKTNKPRRGSRLY